MASWSMPSFRASVTLSLVSVPMKALGRITSQRTKSRRIANLMVDDVYATTYQQPHAGCLGSYFKEEWHAHGTVHDIQRGRIHLKESVLGFLLAQSVLDLLLAQLRSILTDLFSSRILLLVQENSRDKNWVNL